MGSDMTELMKIVVYLLFIGWRRSIGRDIEHPFDYSNRSSGCLAGPNTASSRKRPNPTVMNRNDVIEEARSIPCILHPFHESELTGLAL